LTQCPKCGAVNKEDSTFCESCGERIEIISNFVQNAVGKMLGMQTFYEKCGTSFETLEHETGSSEVQHRYKSDIMKIYLEIVLIK